MHVLLYTLWAANFWSPDPVARRHYMTPSPGGQLDLPVHLGWGGSPSTWIFGTGSCYSAEYVSRKDTGMERALRSHWFVQSLTNHTCTDCRSHLRIGLKSWTHGHILVEGFIGVNTQVIWTVKCMYLGRLTYMYMLIYIWTSNSPNELRNVAPKGGPFRCLDLRHNDDG